MAVLKSDVCRAKRTCTASSPTMATHTVIVRTRGDPEESLTVVRAVRWSTRNTPAHATPWRGSTESTPSTCHIPTPNMHRKYERSVKTKSSGGGPVQRRENAGELRERRGRGWRHCHQRRDCCFLTAFDKHPDTMTTVTCFDRSRLPSLLGRVAGKSHPCHVLRVPNSQVGAAILPQAMHPAPPPPTVHLLPRLPSLPPTQLCHLWCIPSMKLPSPKVQLRKFCVLPSGVAHMLEGD